MIYDLSFPHWDLIDTDRKCLAIDPEKLSQVFESISKKFVFHAIHGSWVDISKSCVSYRARIHLNARKTPSAVKGLLKKAGVMSTVTATAAEPGSRDEDGFYMMFEGELIKLLGPAWVDPKKAKIDAGKRRLAEICEKIKEENRAAKKAKKNGETEAEAVIPKPTPPKPEEKRHQDYGKWADTFSLYVNIQTGNVIDVLFIDEGQKDVHSYSLYNTMLLRGGCPIFDYENRPSPCAWRKGDIKDLDPDETGSICPDYLRANINSPDDQILNYAEGDKYRAKLHIVDITAMRRASELRAKIKGSPSIPFDIVKIWDHVVHVKKGHVPGREPCEFKNKMAVFTDELPDPKKHPGICFRLWRVEEQKLNTKWLDGCYKH